MTQPFSARSPSSPALHPRRGRACGWLLAGLLAAPLAIAQAEATPPVHRSAMDAELFMQIFVSELDQRQGESAQAIQRMTTLAQRQKDDRLFQRAVDMAIQARAAEPAVATLKAWRQTLPKSLTAAQMQAQILAALGRPGEAATAAKAWIELTPVPQRPAVLLGLPRLAVRGTQAASMAPALDEVLKPWRTNPATRSAALLATARIWMTAGEATKAIDAARDAQATDPGSDGAAVIALELMGQEPRAEDLVRQYLRSDKPAGIVRVGYARRLTAAQRYNEAASVLDDATRADPQMAGAWLMQGALQLELGQPGQARQALLRYVDLRSAASTAASASSAAEADAAEEAPEADEGDAQELSQAYLMLAQAAEQQGDYRAAQEWLDKLGDQARSGPALNRRASLLARQGRVQEAQALLSQLPEATPEQARAKLMAQAQLLREVQQWKDAHALLQQANERFPNDPDLLYEQALLAEKLTRFDEMEQLLRRVIELKPDQQHAYNALGYSLADRGIRLDEARRLVNQALALSPGDPFITDSLGWVEFRLGNRQDALRLLREAYARRPDTEIAAHLGEVLWADGQQEEARSVWRAGQERDAANEVLKQTLQRLRVKL